MKYVITTDATYLSHIEPLGGTPPVGSNNLMYVDIKYG